MKRIKSAGYLRDSRRCAFDNALCFVSIGRLVPEIAPLESQRVRARGRLNDSEIPGRRRDLHFFRESRTTRWWWGKSVDSASVADQRTRGER